MRSAIRLLLVFGLAACGRRPAPPDLADALAMPAESCLGCHARLNPGLVADHQASPHSLLDPPLGCEDCHGSDHSRIFRDAAAVPPSVCRKCHAEAFEAFARSTHGQRLKQGKLDALLLDATPAAGGCTATTGCHSIQRAYPDGSVGRCSTCHVSHAFRNAQARDPRVCIGCHGGVDHPQFEAWQRSSHAMESPSHDGPIAGCIDCHDPHDVSAGIVKGMPPVSYEPPVGIIPAADPEQFAAARAEMTARCRRCHSARLTRVTLEQADRWRHRGAVLLERANRIVRDLHRDGLLDLPPEARLPNPVVGHALRLGGVQFLDPEVSLPERIYYEMYFHHYPALWRAAYHTDPERISWEGNDAMKSALDRLLALDRELRRGAMVTEENQK